jgi:hypothetical protein
MAGELLQATPIPNFDEAAHSGKNASALQKLDCLGHGRTPHTEYARKQVLSNSELVPVASILRSQQPACKALAKRVTETAGCRL